MLHCFYCSAASTVFMSEIVDQALRSYELASEMDAAQISRLREQTSRYIGKLMSAGQHDPNRLTEYAQAYLKELHEGPDPRFTGC
jgi:hypothetical protein